MGVETVIDLSDLKTLTIQLVHGKPDGIRICRVEGETLLTVIVPREDLSEAKELPEIPDRGIYYLLDESHGVISRVYAGQTTQGIDRLESHKAKKEFWNTAVMFLTDNQNMSQDVVNGLEAKAIEYVKTHGSYENDNVQIPNPYVSPYSRASIERLHRSILFRMAALGYDLNREYDGPEEGSTLFHTRKGGVKGLGKYDKNTGRFTVLVGSEVNLDRKIIKNEGAIKKRRELFGSAIGKAVASQDIEFSTPSAAAVFVLGGSQNGWTEWVNDLGQTLDFVYRSRV